MEAGKVVVVFSGYNNRAVVSFIRTLEKNRIQYAVVARDSLDPIFKTAYGDKVVVTRSSKSLDLRSIKQVLESVKAKFGRAQYFIAPSTEALNRFLQKERVALETMNIVVPLCDAGVYVSVSDKETFGKLCQKSGILIPNEYDSIESAIFPFVAKPRKYAARDGSIYLPSLIFNSDHKESFLKKRDPNDFYFQEFVGGRSIYLLYYFHRNGKIFKYSQENLIQQPDGKSIVAAISSDFHNTEESVKYEHLFKTMGFFGLVMVEVKVGNHEAVMIEANPRFWGPAQLFVDAGMNFFEVFLHDYGIVSREPVFRNQSLFKYFWFGGVQSTIRAGQDLCFYNKGDDGMLKGKIISNLATWVDCDVFNRPDTIEIFRDETI